MCLFKLVFGTKTYTYIKQGSLLKQFGFFQPAISCIWHILDNILPIVLCVCYPQAYKEKLYGKKYVWLIIGWYPDNWYKVDDDRHNCTAEQLEEALEGHLTTEAVILHQEPTMTDVGMVR